MTDNDWATDMNGWMIRPGDLVVYAGLHGPAAVLRKARVKRIRPDGSLVLAVSETKEAVRKTHMVAACSEAFRE